MSTTVHVEGISAQTTEKEVRDFFSFCGKISSLSVTPTSDESSSTKSATVTFEKETAAKTALLLDNTQLGPAQVTVKSAASLGDLAPAAKEAEQGGDEVAQEDKPRRRIVAEYLAHGYVISDKVIERALALDKQHGVSNRFTKALVDFDSKYKATEKAKVADEKYQVSQKASSAWDTMNSYFESALSTPTGQKLRNFYTEGEKQVIDVHNEARHLANLKSGKPATGSGPAESSSSAVPLTTDEKPTESTVPAPASGATELPTSEKSATS
jgi:RNA recognition motif-containing protein